MGKWAFSTIVVASFFGVDVAGKRISHIASHVHVKSRSESPTLAGLSEECQPSIPPKGCVTGSAFKKSLFGDYCECLNGKHFVDSSSSSQKCKVAGSANYFRVSEVTKNPSDYDGCVCPGIGDRICAEQVSIIIANGEQKNSALKCQANFVCKIDVGQFCNPDQASENGAVGDLAAHNCNHPHAGCGIISHRCIPRLAHIKEAYLSHQATTGNAKAADAIKELKKTSLEQNTFDENSWDNEVAKTCESAGLTKFCYP